MLPKIIAPTFKLTLPSSKKEISYRPFLVKEEKILLLAAQSRDPEDIKMAISQVIENCVLTEGFSVKDSPIFDITWILINLRIKSIGGKVTRDFQCTGNNGACGQPFQITYDLGDITEITTTPKKEIMLDDNLGVILRYPRFGYMNELSDEEFDYKLLRETIDSVYDKNSTYKLDEASEEEVIEFLESLSKTQYEKITDFLRGLPRFEVNKSHTCTKCGTIHDIQINDLEQLF